MSGDGTDRTRPVRVRANAALAERIARTDRGSTVLLATREATRLHQTVRLELGLGPLADEILVDAVVREIRPAEDPAGPPEVLFAIVPKHEERFGYVHDVITGRRGIVTRRHRRVVARLPVVWTFGGRSGRSFTGDVGAGGTFVLGHDGPPPASHVDLELWLEPDRSTSLQGIVTWIGTSHGDDGFGVKFRNVDAETFAMLRDLVRSREDV